MLARINKSYVPTYWDDFFNDSFFKSVNTINCNGTSPAVNVIEDEKEYRIDVAVPGMTRNEFRIDLDDDVLTISSEKKENDEEDESNNPRYMRREFSYSTFKRSFQLPDTIDQENIKASHDAGILTITLAKKEEVVQKAPKQIEIK
ncbi:MAG: Hsp20/alpha crystallin family protein [Bacteroidales bacterium]|nr:Hsp20/alpha crystallin family protein [Bacteroidales bacterium]